MPDYSGVSSQFVTSLTAPVASGRSESDRVGSHPQEKRRLSTAHVEAG